MYSEKRFDTAFTTAPRGGAGGDKVRVLGKERKVVQCVMYQGRLVKLSDARKLEKKAASKAMK